MREAQILSHPQVGVSGAIRHQQTERYSAIYQITITLALAGGAAVGGVIVDYWSYKAVFITSGVGRLLAALLFARFSRQAVVNR